MDPQAARFERRSVHEHRNPPAKEEEEL